MNIKPREYSLKSTLVPSFCDEYLYSWQFWRDSSGWHCSWICCDNHARHCRRYSRRCMYNGATVGIIVFSITGAYSRIRCGRGLKHCQQMRHCHIVLTASGCRIKIERLTLLSTRRLVGSPTNCATINPTTGVLYVAVYGFLSHGFVCLQVRRHIRASGDHVKSKRVHSDGCNQVKAQTPPSHQADNENSRHCYVQIVRWVKSPCCSTLQVFVDSPHTSPLGPVCMARMCSQPAIL